MNLFAVFVMLFCSTGWSSEPTVEESPVHKKLARALHAHIVAETEQAEQDVEIQWLGYAAQIPCAETADVWVETLPGEQFRGQSTARVTFVEPTGVCGKVSVPFRSAFWAHVPVAAADTRAGQIVELDTKRVLASEIRGIIIDPESGPWIAVGTLRKGDAVTHRRVKRQPLASVGDSIKIIAEYGALTVSAEGRLLADAFLGDRVRVANLATDVVVQGVLIGPGKVRAGVRK